MRNYLLTEKERKILETYVNHGIKLDGFAVAMTRIRKIKDYIEDDLMLMIKASTKLYEEKSKRRESRSRKGKR